MGEVGWCFDNSYGRLPAHFYARLAPVPVAQPRLVLCNDALAQQMGLDFSQVDAHTLAQQLSGNQLPTGAEPLAQAYAGHQFGHFTMLGDGRAIVLGEHLTPSGQRLDVQLKGSGRTPFSRNGDGRAALGPMLREYIISEAMHGLGIATTRSLAVVATGEVVMREEPLAGAILTRVAASHVRVGSFQYLAMREDEAGLAQLAAYTLARHYPERQGGDNPALELLKGVLQRQLSLVVAWMRVGFIHGVMNTDNTTLSGETIDYGPCAFMDHYHKDTVFSSIDHAGRYRYGNQPRMIRWNLARLAEALLPLLHPKPNKAIALAEEVVFAFDDRYTASWREMMAHKLGLFELQDGDDALMEQLLTWMQQSQADYTQTFRQLSTPAGSPPWLASLEPWWQQWQARLARQAQPLERVYARMQQVNPAIIPRNHRVEAALQAATEAGDLAPVRQLVAALQDPYHDGVAQQAYVTPPAPAQVAHYQTFCGT
ncbi:protein of unknown function UPF0061 [Magnetococcus marinus MC-1]|uniref:Protein nucleotidyltransferase YdiU n=1 Tax=Magnetococcus marinus (strain ATCC BAA-1437 / JCM 17883 / MC-1) TaxID=156889 RepID=A0LAM8_MAGMM|nr:YdiU family protein [Magnetococcus marinus]ABK45021.1 protein of unknown function UPF0061 [Magnetococcus marinus MC-1]